MQQRAINAAGAMPFASYAQLVRMLVPLADKVSFYDATGETLWISDGVDEPGLRRHIEQLVAQHAARGAREPVAQTIEETAGPTYLLPIETDDGALLGAIGIVCRDTLASAAMKRSTMVHRLLAPLIEVLRHGWHPQTRPPMVTEGSANATATPAPIVQPDSATPLPALLRRTLAQATQQLSCAFGAIVVPDRPFMLSHRVSADESDLDVNAAIDNARTHMSRWMTVRNEPLIVNSVAPGSAQFSPYKFVVLPLRVGASRLAALIMMFRTKRDRDFDSADVDELIRVAMQMSGAALSELAAPSAEATQASPLPVRTGTVAAPAAHRPTTPSKPLTMDERVRAALGNGDFRLAVQRISPLRESQRPARYEVLLRMRDADELRAPHVRLSDSNADELMPALDRWVIQSLLRTLREHSTQIRSAGLEFCINVAAPSLIAEGFADFVVAEVCRSSIPAGLLVFELSESNALRHDGEVDVFAARLRDVGCRIALDNCRAGFGTLGTLRRWPVSCVKIDGSLIRDVVQNPRCESLVHAVAQLATGMGIETVAECVETDAIRTKLLHMGIDYAQGFHFGKPQPIATLFQ